MEELWNVFLNITPLLISLVAIILTAFNVNEVRKQRIKMYEPILVLEEGNWDSALSEDISPVLKLRNVGYGTALDIRCKWNPEINLTTSKVFPNGVKEDFILANYRELKKGKLMPSIVNKNDDFNLEFQYLMPVNIENSTLKIKTPSLPFFETIEYTRIFVENGKKDEDQYLLKSRNYKLEISYKDINEKLFKKFFKVEVRNSLVDYNYYDKENKIILYVSAIVE